MKLKFKIKTEDQRDVQVLDQLYLYLVKKYTFVHPKFCSLIVIKDKKELNKLERQIEFYEEAKFLDVKFRILDMNENTFGDKRNSIDYPLEVLSELESRLFKK